MWLDQREKPNNLKLAHQTKALIHNQLVDKAKARLPTFSHNLHLVVHYISLTLKNIHQITTCRLFEKKSISARHFHGQKYGTAKNASIRNRGDAYDITDVLDFSNFLPERTRDIFYMSRIEGMTHSEIAEILGISTRAVEKLLQNSVQEYRRHFGISDRHHKPS